MNTYLRWCTWSVAGMLYEHQQGMTSALPTFLWLICSILCWFPWLIGNVYAWFQGLGWTLKTGVDETPFPVFNVRVEDYAHNKRVLICMVFCMCGDWPWSCTGWKPSLGPSLQHRWTHMNNIHPRNQKGLVWFGSICQMKLCSSTCVHFASWSLVGCLTCSKQPACDTFWITKSQSGLCFVSCIFWSIMK